MADAKPMEATSTDNTIHKAGRCAMLVLSETGIPPNTTKTFWCATHKTTATERKT